MTSNAFKSNEDAYKAIANEILSFVGDRKWEKSGASYEILNKSISSSWWRVENEAIDKKGDFPPKEKSLFATSAVRHLCDEIFKNTGQRIWGVDFTLFPSGKFNIEYDYKKPDDYEESDEVITGDEINASLNQLTGKDNTSS